MIVLRGVEKRDLVSLEKFSHVPGMFNLPSDPEVLGERIQKSLRSFAGKVERRADSKYTFVAEDLDSRQIVGTSMIAGQHGTPESPHYFFEVGREERYSSALSTGFIHGTLTLGTDSDGPAEIGALVVDEKMRAAPQKIGRQISFVRFLYLALHPDRFQPKIIAELLPPLNKRGQSPLWEAVGRRFTNMDYWEADRLSASNKDFILELFPSGKIYTTFLPAEARNAIGKIGKDTLPVQHMLERIGFTYRHQIDPFDGGPHFWANVSELMPVKNLRRAKYSVDRALHGERLEGLVTKLGTDTEFRACSAEMLFSANEAVVLTDAVKIEGALSLNPGDDIAFIPYN